MGGGGDAGPVWVAEDLSIVNPTIKRILSDMVNRDVLARYGKGAGTNYTIR